MRHAAAIAVLAAGAAWAGARMPSIDEAARRHAPAVFAVQLDSGARTGFLLTSTGLAVTVLPAAALQAAPTAAVDGEALRVVLDGVSRPAAVIVRREDGLALLQLQTQPDEVLPALAVRTAPFVPSPHAWLMAITADGGVATPTLGGARSTGARWQLDLPAGPGAPVLFDHQVVGVVVARAGKTGSVAVDVTALLALVQQHRHATPAPSQ